MAELSDIIKRLKENDKSQDQTTEAIDELTQVFRKKFLAEERGRLDGLERRRERRPAAPMPTLTGALAAPMSLFDDFMSMLNRLAIPGAIGALASIGEFDDLIRAVGVPSMVLKANNALTRAAGVVTSLNDFFKNIFDKIKVGTIKTAKFADVAFVKPIVRFGQFVGDVFKPIGAFINLAFIKPIVRIGQFVGDAFKAVGNFIDLNFIKPVVRFGTAAGEAGFKAIGKFLDLPIVKPIVQFIDGTGKAIANVTDYLKVRLPDFSKISIGNVPQMPVFEGFEKVRTFLFGAADAVTGARAGGAFGFFKTIADFKPIKIVAGRYVQGVLILIDGIMGFFREFNKKTELVTIGSATFERELSMEDRILAGLEGAADGVVKGITDAFQAFFIDIPIWLVRKITGVDLGKTALGEVDLWTDLVQPIWDGIKAVFKFIFSADYRSKVWQDSMAQLKTVVTGPDGLISDLKNWFTNLFDFLPSWEEVKETLKSLLPDWMRKDPEAKAAIKKHLNEKNVNSLANLEDQKLQAEEAKRIIAGIVGVDPNNLTRRDLDSKKLNLQDQATLQMINRLNALKGNNLGYDFIDAEINRLKPLIAEGALGGLTNSAISKRLGHLMSIHPNELIIPLDNTSEGAALKKLDKILNPSNAELAMAQSKNSRMSGANMAPIIINNVDNSNVNNSQSDRRTYVATGGATDGFNLNQTVQ